MTNDQHFTKKDLRRPNWKAGRVVSLCCCVFNPYPFAYFQDVNVMPDMQIMYLPFLFPVPDKNTDSDVGFKLKE